MRVSALRSDNKRNKSERNKIDVKCIVTTGILQSMWTRIACTLALAKSKQLLGLLFMYLAFIVRLTNPSVDYISSVWF